MTHRNISHHFNYPSPYINENSTKDTDAVWIFLSVFVIFLMETGFALLESGCCSTKNSVTAIMNKIAVVLFNGITYWSVGYSLQYGEEHGSNKFMGYGPLFLTSSGKAVGDRYIHFIFQYTFMSTTCSIVSGSVLERFNFNAFCAFCSCFFVIYCFPGGWIWRDNGWLYHLGAVDYCGALCVHLLGGTSALVAAWKVGPRIAFFKETEKLKATDAGNPVNVVIGAQILW